MTLLKNEKGLLPLSRDIAKIAIIGPHADEWRSVSQPNVSGRAEDDARAGDGW